MYKVKQSLDDVEVKSLSVRVRGPLIGLFPTGVFVASRSLGTGLRFLFLRPSMFCEGCIDSVVTVLSSLVLHSRPSGVTSPRVTVGQEVRETVHQVLLTVIRRGPFTRGSPWFTGFNPPVETLTV